MGTIRVWIVDSGGVGEHGFGRVPPFGFTGLAPTICGRGYDGDELAEEVARSAGEASACAGWRSIGGKWVHVLGAAVGLQ